MIPQACLNGARSRDEHPAVPVTPSELAADAVAVAGLGVVSAHVHPRAADGTETLVASLVGNTVSAIRAAAPGVAIGVTTGAWIEPDPRRRVAAVGAWAALGAGRPDFASVNVHEDGWVEVCAALAEAGVGIELGVFTVDAAAELRRVGPPAGVVRVLAEVQTDDIADAHALLAALSWVEPPVLLHGQDAGTWPVLDLAVERGLDTRIGLEDTLHLTDGTRAGDNAALVAMAMRQKDARR